MSCSLSVPLNAQGYASLPLITAETISAAPLPCSVLHPSVSCIFLAGRKISLSITIASLRRSSRRLNLITVKKNRPAPREAHNLGRGLKGCEGGGRLRREFERRAALHWAQEFSPVNPSSSDLAEGHSAGRFPV